MIANLKSYIERILLMRINVLDAIYQFCVNFFFKIFYICLVIKNVNNKYYFVNIMNEIDC